MEQNSETLLPARMLNEWVYCPRLFYLEWVQGEWADNADTISGKMVHKRVDAKSQPLPRTDVDEEEQEERKKLIARSVWLSDGELRLTAKIDLVEAQGQDATPVEYKRGSGPDGATRMGGQVWDADRVQVGVQALLLRAHGYRCEKAVVYYATTKTRVTFPVDDALLEWVKQQRDEALVASEKELPPEPLKNSPKCVRCSLAPICLPDEVNLLTDLEETKKEKQADDEVSVRRLIPARDDTMPLVVQKHGATVGLSGECLVVRMGKEVLAEVRLMDVSDVAVHGSASVTTPTLKTLLDRGIGVSYFSSGGWFYGMTVGHHHNNILLRDAQYRTRFDTEKSLFLARRFVAMKIWNQRTMLRRNHGTVDKQVLDDLGGLAKRVDTAQDTGVLLGLEGLAARMYFGAFAGMLKGEWANVAGVFEGRNRRPPKDPINAMLSFGYAMLTKDVTLTLSRVGFDPLAGFYHAIRHGKPALALDVMEEFRPLVVDSAVLTAVNTGMVQPKDFVTGATGCALSDSGRRAFVDAYAKRMDELVTHPTFGYRISYRQVLEVQARLLGRHIMGEIKEFPGFKTR